MSALRIAFLVAALVLTAAVDLFAQQAVPVARGKRVRVTTASLTHIGTVLESKSDTLVLDVEGRAVPLAIAVASITRLDVSRGRESHAFTGGCIGFLAGAATGVAMGFASGDESAPCIMACSAEDKALLGGVLGGVAGAAVGFAVGRSSTASVGSRCTLGVGSASVSGRTARVASRSPCRSPSDGDRERHTLLPPCRPSAP